jgi:hypothetical protein
MAMSPAERLRRNAERRRIVREEEICSQCYKPFVPARRDALFCSNRCRQAHHREQVRMAEGDARDAVLKAEGMTDYRRPRTTTLDLVAQYADGLAREGIEVTPEALSAHSDGWYTPLDAKVALAWLKAERRIV